MLFLKLNKTEKLQIQSWGVQLVAPKKLDQIMADVTASNLKRYQIQGDQKISPVLRAPRAPLATDLARSPAIWHIPPCAPVSLRLLPPGFSFPPLRSRGRRRSLRSGRPKKAPLARTSAPLRFAPFRSGPGERSLFWTASAPAAPPATLAPLRKTETLRKQAPRTSAHSGLCQMAGDLAKSVALRGSAR